MSYGELRLAHGARDAVALALKPQAMPVRSPAAMPAPMAVPTPAAMPTPTTVPTPTAMPAPATMPAPTGLGDHVVVLNGLCGILQANAQDASVSGGRQVRKRNYANGNCSSSHKVLFHRIISIKRTPNLCAE